MSEALATKDDPKGTLSYRLARAAVIILGVLLVVALGTLVVGLVLKMRGYQPPEQTNAAARYVLPPGARIVSMESQPGRLVLHVRSPAGDEVDIVDIQSGRLIGQIKASGP